MLVVLRFRVDSAEEAVFRSEAEQAIGVLTERPGFLEASIGRATDDPDLWLVLLRFASVGSYRRALSSYEVKVGAVPLLSRALDEPTAFEILSGAGATEPNVAKPRGGAGGPAGSLS